MEYRTCVPPGMARAMSGSALKTQDRFLFRLCDETYAVVGGACREDTMMMEHHFLGHLSRSIESEIRRAPKILKGRDAKFAIEIDGQVLSGDLRPDRSL